jgi:hypothetical protein
MPNSRGRKRQKPRRPQHSAPVTWQAEVLQSARPLLDSRTSRHQAELWASALLGEATEGRVLVRRHAQEVWVQQVLRYADRRRTPEAAALVLALAAVCVKVPQPMTTWAAGVLGHLSWTHRPPLTPMRLTRSSDPWDDCRVWLLEYDDHVLAVTTARGQLRDVVGLHVLAPGTPERWDALAPAVLALPRQEVDVDKGLSELKRISDLQRRTGAWRGPGQSALAQLLEARLHHARVEARDCEIDEELRLRAVAAFAQEYHLPDVETLLESCRPILDFAERYLDGNPLLWSPALVDVFLLEWVPWEAEAYLEVLAEVPLVLGLWVSWALRLRGLDPVCVFATFDRAHRLQDPSRSACEAALLELGYEREDFPLTWRRSAA